MTNKTFVNTFKGIKVNPGYSLGYEWVNMKDGVVKVTLLKPTLDINTGKKTHLYNEMNVELKGLYKKDLFDLIVEFIIDVEIHETHEWFKYKGKQVYSPH